MRVRSFEELMLLPGELAVARHLDGVNWQRGRWFLGGYLFAALVAGIAFASLDFDFRLWIALADLAVLAAFFLLRRTKPVEEAFRPVVAGLVSLQFLATILWSTDPVPVLVFGLVPFPLVLLVLRFRPAEAAFVVATLAAGTAGWFLAQGGTVARAALLGLAVAGPASAAAVASARVTLRQRKEFLDRWHRVETTDFRSDCYGFDRLERALGRAAGTGEAREVRTHILEDVAHFKGQNLQGDDLSLVVARFRAGVRDGTPEPALIDA